jgi:suppressor of G2 allele of SKP1
MESKEKKVSKFVEEWFQTSETITITIFAKKVPKENVSVDFTGENVSLAIKFEEGEDYKYEKNLFATIVPEKCKLRVTAYKIEVVLVKELSSDWDALEPDETGAKSFEVEEVKDSIHSYPSSSKKHFDWDEVDKKAKDEEEKETPQGDAAMMKLLRDIYSKADIDTRMAMEKSFTESGGTVLSTNWGEVSQKKVDIQAPDGMLAKKWE